MRWLMVAAAMAIAGPAAAQGMLGRSGAARPPAETTAPRPPPPALPGIQGQQRVAPIPAEVPPSSMNPNDALFDGINRGDLPAIRDAVTRGADVNARNALGLTALDSAVDQGRADVTFYLLSVRGTAGNAPAPDSGTRGRPQRAAAPLRETAAERRAAAAAAPPATAAPRRAHLFAGNGGAPIAQLGFLGFDAGRPAGAAPLDDTPRGRRQRG